MEVFTISFDSFFNHITASNNEIDRTELLENDVTQETEIPFTKTLLIRDSEFNTSSLPIITAFSLRDPLNPECLGCQRVTLDNLMGLTKYLLILNCFAFL